MKRTASPAVEHVPDQRLKEFCVAGTALLKHTAVHRAVPSVERGTLARKTGRTTVLALVLVISSLSGAYASVSPVASASTGNVATRWVERALDAVRSGSPATHTSTPGAARTYALTTVAMYDAVNGIESAARVSSRRPAIIGSYAAAPASGDPRAAASAAAHRVLSSLFARNVAVKDVLDRAHEVELVDLGPVSGVESGRAWGASVGNQVLQLRAADGTQSEESLEAGSGPGTFPRRFNGAQFRNMTPFGIATVSPYRSSGPPPLASEAYADALNEVKVLGSSADTDPERTAIARQWLAEGRTVRETGLWFKAALDVVARQGTVAALPDTVRLFALIGMGVADAVTVSWNDKYDSHYWRPGDAIRQADLDGNPATEADPTWSPRNGTCSATTVASCGVFGGTPEHTSGTSTFAGAAAAILAGFYCTDAISFSFAGEQQGVAPRTYSGFSEAAREAGRSRIYGGIHLQFSNEAGREAGKGIGREIVRTRLRAAAGHPDARSACTHSAVNA